MPTYELKPRPCPLCGAEGAKQLFEQRFEQMDKSYFVSECVNCGLIHQNPSWNQEFYDSLYENLVYDPSGRVHHPAQAERYAGVADVIGNLVSGKSGGKMLDFGCYDGSFIDWVKKERSDWAKNFKFSGYDIFLKDVSPGSGFYNSLDDLKKTGERFDVIIFNHVIEHVLDPVPYLKMIKESFLAEGGYAVIELPDISFIRKDEISPYHIQHTNYFSPFTMAKFLNTVGLAVERITTFKNAGIRDPHFPTLLLVGQKSADFVESGEDLKKKVSAQRQRFAEKLNAFGEKAIVGIAGCGDPLVLVHGLLPKGHKLQYLFDNNKTLWGKELLGVKVSPIADIKGANLDYVVVCTMHERNSRLLHEQLSEFVDPQKIVNVLDVD